MALGTSDLTPTRKAAPAKPQKAAPAKPAKGFRRIYPTHRRQAGPLVVSLPSDGINSPDPLEITDDGADVEEDLAQHLINGGEATTSAPSEAD